MKIDVSEQTRERTSENECQESKKHIQNNSENDNLSGAGHVPIPGVHTAAMSSARPPRLHVFSSYVIVPIACYM
jgi:hypothetical protein